MKSHYLYELQDSTKNVVYVGQSCRPKLRMRQHIKYKPNPNNGTDGMFYSRTDLTMVIVSEHLGRAEAQHEETRLKIQHGLQPTEYLNTKNMGLRKRVATVDQALEIRSKYTGAWGQMTRLSEEYGITLRSISRIINHKVHINK